MLHNLTALERDIAATDDEFDGRVFALYGLTDKEIKLVKESQVSTLSPVRAFFCFLFGRILLSFSHRNCHI